MSTALKAWAASNRKLLACSPKTDNAGDVPPPHEPRDPLGIAALEQANVLGMPFLERIPDTTCASAQMSCKDRLKVML
jgi:hypothetical protein